MKKYLFLILIISILIIGCTGTEEIENQPELPENNTQEIQPQEPEPTLHLSLTTNAFENNGKIPERYTCDGQDIAPELAIENIPENTETLVLILDDPDAVPVAGKVWDHWIVFNIPSTGNILEGTEGKNSFNSLGYGGPCPPSGQEHEYIFTVYSLDTTLDLEERSTKSEVEAAMQGHILEQAQLIGIYY